MKVIGRSTEERFFVEATATEILNLFGFGSRYDNAAPRIDVGTEIKISDVWFQLEALRRKREALDNLAAELRQVADLLEHRSPIVNQALVLEAPKP